MNDFDRQLRELFDRGPRLDPDRGDAVRKEIVHMYDERLKKVQRYAWIWILGTCAVMVVAGALIGIGAAMNTRVLVIGAMILLLAGQFQMLVKLWYWQMNTKLNLMKELKELRLQLTELNSDRQTDED